MLQATTRRLLIRKSYVEQNTLETTSASERSTPIILFGKEKQKREEAGRRKEREGGMDGGRGTGGGPKQTNTEA